MTGYETTTAAITIGTETREVEADSLKGTVAESDRLFVHGVVGTIGRGIARYPTTITLHLIPEGGKAHAGNKTTTTPDGRVWQYHLATCIRNRQARVVGFTEVVGATNSQDQTRRGA